MDAWVASQKAGKASKAQSHVQGVSLSQLINTRGELRGIRLHAELILRVAI
tara:strand:- start:446 stop:598 length:153 start_codon:yes stop_codon:yes gene_type:complete